MNSYIDFGRLLDLNVKIFFMTNIVWMVYIFVRVRSVYRYHVIEFGDIWLLLLITSVIFVSSTLWIVSLIKNRSRDSMVHFFVANWVAAISFGFTSAFAYSWIFSFYLS